jgi:hypothetical protein
MKVSQSELRSVDKILKAKLMGEWNASTNPNSKPCIQAIENIADEPYKPDSVELRQVGVLTIIPLGCNSHCSSSSLPEGCSRERPACLAQLRSVSEGVPQNLPA